MEAMMQLIRMVGRCSVCGSEKIGEGSKFVIENDSFERTCGNCGWKASGIIKNSRIVIENNNARELTKM